MGLSSIQQIIIGDEVTSIGKNAFSGCSGLSSITIGNSVTYIGERAFYNCTALKDITIPENVTSIGSQAFDGCTRLRKVTCLGTTPPTITAESFPNRTKETLYVPKGCKAAYEDADYWWEFKEIIEQGTSQGGPKGDMNGDGVVDISDALYIIDMVLGRVPQ